MNRRDLLKVFGGAAGIPAVQSIERLEVKPEDTIVVTYPGPLSDRTATAIANAIKGKFPEQKVLVLGEGMTIKVLRKT